MSPKSEALLIVVSVLEGRDFPTSRRQQLVVQAKFDGEQLSTDPVEHRDQPQFCTELAWELDRRTLHQHRLQRTPMKLQCVTLDSSTQATECVGYVLLDLRCIQQHQQEPRWHPLLGSKSSLHRPSLLLRVQLEADTRTPHASPDTFRAKKAPPRQGAVAEADLLPARLEAVLVQDQGYHQVGPPEQCSDMFLLSLTLAFASKLEQLVPSTLQLAAEGSEFFFYYSLLGNDITSAPFLNLLSPSFQPERASVRIRSSKQVLLGYLGQQPALQVHLCCGSRSLGSAEVPLSDLAHCGAALDRQTATVEGVFVLNTAEAPPPDRQPTVGLALTLRREQLPGNRDGGDGPQVTHLPDAPPPPPPPQPARLPGHSGLGEVVEEETQVVEVVVDEKREEEEEEEEEDVVQEVQEVEVEVEEAQGKRVFSIPASSHHFCFSLDLRSLKNRTLSHTLSVVLRYWYRFLGSRSPITTSPAVDVPREADVFLPQSFCSFHLAAAPGQVQQVFTSVPLVVEVWHRSPGSRDQLVGSASIALSSLLSADRTTFLGALGQPASRQTVTRTAPILSPHGETVAELFYVATLEDLGRASTQRELEAQQQNQQAEASALVPSQGPELGPSRTPALVPSQAPALVPSQAPDPGPSQASTLGPSQAPDPGPSQASVPGPSQASVLGPSRASVLGPSRDTLEYRTAVELELWKEEQEELFHHQLRRRELDHMQVLAEEWRRRDGEREALVKKKELEYKQLEERLQKALEALESREKQLELAHLESQSMQRQLQERSSQLLRDYEQRGALERHKLALVEQERDRLLQQVEEGESKYTCLQNEFSMFREQQHHRPEVRLQSEINLLTLEKVELERKLESTTKSKLHYKQQWGRGLKELARFKQREQENALHRLKKQQEELEAMRLRYLATEEKEAVRSDRQELDSLRNQLNRLKQQEESLGPTPSEGAGPEHLSRLLEERDSLLRTGVYTHNDLIISQLNTQIQQAMTSRGQH